MQCASSTAIRRRSRLGSSAPDRRLDPLGGRVAELVLAGRQIARALPPLVGVQRRAQVGRAHPDLAHRVHLILHERDQRRYHQRRSAQHARRDLIGDRLPAPVGMTPTQSRPGEQRLDDLLLAGAERIVAEHLSQHAQGRRVRRLRERGRDLTQQRNGVGVEGGGTAPPQRAQAGQLPHAAGEQPGVIGIAARASGRRARGRRWRRQSPAREGRRASLRWSCWSSAGVIGERWHLSRVGSPTVPAA